MAARALVWIKGKIGLHPEPGPPDDGRELVAAELDRLAALIRSDGTKARMHVRRDRDRAFFRERTESTLEALASDGSRVCVTVWI